MLIILLKVESLPPPCALCSAGRTAHPPAASAGEHQPEVRWFAVHSLIDKRTEGDSELHEDQVCTASAHLTATGNCLKYSFQVSGKYETRNVRCSLYHSQPTLHPQGT